MAEQCLEIPESVIDEVVSALSMAIGLASVKEPALHKTFMEAAVRLDEAINDATATEE